MIDIFINYRKDDSAASAELIDKSMCDRFGADRVFRDCRSMEPGAMFTKELEIALRQSRVMLSVIGPQWLSLADSSGRPRIENPKDILRLELKRAFNWHITVIPVLVGGAKLPRMDELPDDIKALNTQQYVEIRHRYVENDTKPLIEAVARRLGGGKQANEATGGSDATRQIRVKGNRNIIGDHTTYNEWNS
ncbi:hypothetical protein Aple_055280 [Acrocarpospora pleiomorpha]|uniref:TIR domain-containing protein n=1 Tax=Acrocarpospora pleiomorpha TaxID=90975 RepID=A0A5M3XNW8_9ACTN|nr:TIR domain-containing protein [Acrocarpospora pleiomorpha]GES22630.1 hypothetical protein Aple_055280 [Acrocarpospora pleiomorpha]